MATTFKKLHWVYPYAFRTWTDAQGDLNTIEISKETDSTGTKVTTINKVFDDDMQLSANASEPVIAPLSGRISIKDTDQYSGAQDVRIETALDDGTRIFNILKGVQKLNPVLKNGYRIAQGEWIGFPHPKTADALFGFTFNTETLTQLPLWYVMVQFPGQSALQYSWAEEAADQMGGIGFEDESKLIDEHGGETPKYRDVANSAENAFDKKTSSDKKKNMLTLGAIVALGYFFLKGK